MDDFEARRGPELAAVRAAVNDGERIEAVEPISFGFSNATYLLRGLDRILRTPPVEEGLLRPYDMAFQHAVMAGVHRSGLLPVPAVFDLVEDAAAIGWPFFVMERVQGASFETDAPGWLLEMTSTQLDEMSRAALEAMVAIARVPVERMPLPVRTPGAEAAFWADKAADAEAGPEVMSLLDDLVADPPPASGPMTLVHGDFKVGNLVWKGTKLVAVLDWELASLGDPLSDLAYYLSFYRPLPGFPPMAALDRPGWWSKAQVVEDWQRRLGRPADGLDRHEALQLAKLAVIVATGAHLYATGRNRDPRLQHWHLAVGAYVDHARSVLA